MSIQHKIDDLTNMLDTCDQVTKQRITEKIKYLEHEKKYIKQFPRSIGKQPTKSIFSSNHSYI